MILHWHFGPFLCKDTKTDREDLFIIQILCAMLCWFVTIRHWTAGMDIVTSETRGHVSIMSQRDQTWHGHVTLASPGTNTHNQEIQGTQALDKQMLWSWGGGLIDRLVIKQRAQSGRQNRFSKVANFKHCKPIRCRLTFLPSLQGGSLYISLL